MLLEIVPIPRYSLLHLPGKIICGRIR